MPLDILTPDQLAKVRDAALRKAKQLPTGFVMERDVDGDPVLYPPADVTIFFEPGEGWLVTDDFMQGRDWSSDADVTDACFEFLSNLDRGA